MSNENSVAIRRCLPGSVERAQSTTGKGDERRNFFDGFGYTPAAGFVRAFLL